MIIVLLLTGLFCLPARANDDLQGRTITVTVKDRQGPVPGANVVVVGHSIGGATDADGVIVLSKVPANAVIEVSFVGYVSKKVTVGSKAKIQVTLEEN